MTSSTLTTLTHHSRAGIGALVCVALLAACSPAGNDSQAASTTTQARAQEKTYPPVHGTELPIEATPELIGKGSQDTCPYLDGQWLQNTSGQRLQGVGVDNRFDPPACVFWSYEDVPQATVLVRSMTSNRDAVAVVDHAAPIDQTTKALEPQGWSGGRRGGLEVPVPGQHPGAVYAVWKDNLAVVVTIAQEQSVKAQQIAEETIKNLML